MRDLAKKALYMLYGEEIIFVTTDIRAYNSNKEIHTIRENNNVEI